MSLLRRRLQGDGRAERRLGPSRDLKEGPVRQADPELGPYLSGCVRERRQEVLRHPSGSSPAARDRRDAAGRRADAVRPDGGIPQSSQGSPRVDGIGKNAFF